MEYLLPNISSINQVSEPTNFYEIDLVKQWLNISPGTILDTINYGSITVINTGLHNKHEGPDIKDAILIINDKVVSGPVECHICTSDWYKHKHHQNPSYQSVILHVVRKINDGIVTPEIPTVLIKPNIHFSNKCSLNNINKSYHFINAIIHNSHNRWLDKINIYSGYHDNRKQLIKLLIINSFKILGAGGNKTQFVKLANNLNYDKYQYLTLQKREKYLWDTSLQLKIKWVRCGIRPAQQPQNRMKLAAEMINYFSNLDFNILPSFNEIKSLITIHLPSATGIVIQTELLGNIVLPFYGTRALYLNEIENHQNYYRIWNNLKLPNAYRKFSKRFGTILEPKQLKSFSMLQGLVAIENNWCSKNLCNICPLKERNYAAS